MIRNSENPPPEEILDLIRTQRVLTDEERLTFFRRVVAYVRQVPLVILRGELLRLHRTVEGWLFWRNLVQIDPDSLISMVITLAILDTHRDIDAQPVILIFRPFVEQHVRDDPDLSPLLTMMNVPENVRNVRNVRTTRLASVETAFTVLLGNIQRRQDDMVVRQV